MRLLKSLDLGKRNKFLFEEVKHNRLASGEFLSSGLATRLREASVILIERAWGQSGVGVGVERAELRAEGWIGVWIGGDLV